MDRKKTRKRKTAQAKTAAKRPGKDRPTTAPAGKKATTRPLSKRKQIGRKPTSGRTTKQQTAATDHGLQAARERLQKVMARAGLGSRRSLEARIAAGEVRVNNETAQTGTTIGEGDIVEFNGRKWLVAASRPDHRTLIYHKPEGEVTTRKDPEGRRTVFDRLPNAGDGRWIAIGRLDINTAGLLVLTTDGELAHRMMHPSGNVDREYLCRIRGAVSDEQIERLLKGVELEDGLARFSDLVPGEVTAGHAWYTVTIMEGRNREVRRLWEAVGVQVARLKRVRFGPVFLPARLRPGRYEQISPADHRILREDVGLKPHPVELELVPPGKAPGGRRA